MQKFSKMLIWTLKYENQIRFQLWNLFYSMQREPWFWGHEGYLKGNMTEITWSKSQVRILFVLIFFSYYSALCNMKVMRQFNRSFYTGILMPTNSVLYRISNPMIENAETKRNDGWSWRISINVKGRCKRAGKPSTCCLSQSAVFTVTYEK